MEDLELSMGCEEPNIPYWILNKKNKILNK